MFVEVYMAVITLLPEISGFDPEAISIIEQRWMIIERFFVSACPSEAPWYESLRIPASQEQRTTLYTRLAPYLLEQPLRNHASPDKLESKIRTKLVPLAEELQFVTQAERVLLQMCIGRGWFRRLGAKGKESQKPRVNELLPTIHTIRTTYTTDVERRAALIALGICRDDAAAYEVAKELSDAHIARYATSNVLALLGSYGEYGAPGLLHISAHPLSDALFLLEQQRAIIHQLRRSNELNIDTDTVIAEIRRDIYALYRGLWEEIPALWQPDLLHAPRDIERRRRYRKELYPRLYYRIVAGIARIRECDAETASNILELFINEGLPGLIGLRIDLAATITYQEIERQRILSVLEHITAGMPQDIQDECQRLVFALLAAAVDAGFQFSFKPLLRERVSSPRRRRWGRRLWFGVPATMLRKRVQRRKWGPQVRQAIRRAYSGKEYAKRLISGFANSAVLDERDARARLRDFLTYGILGLLPRTTRVRAIDPRLFAWLEMMKLGSLDGAVMWPAIARQLHIYAQHLRIPTPAEQISRSLYSSITKPRYWHGGKGKAVALLCDLGEKVVYC